MMQDTKTPTIRDVDSNEEPVFYCEECLSLRILSLEDTDTLYCDTCGNTSINSCSIEEWDKKYQEKYNHPYINKKTK